MMTHTIHYQDIINLDADALYEMVREQYNDLYHNETGRDIGSVGLRFDSRKNLVGKFLPASIDWYNADNNGHFPEYNTREYDDAPRLDGTSAFRGGRPVDLDGRYGDETWYLVVGCDETYGTDDNEIVIKDAMAVAIIER